MKPHRQIPPYIPEERLNSPYDIAVCMAGKSGCKNAIVDVKVIAENIRLNLDACGLGEFIKTKGNGNLPYHMRFKAAVAGCPNSCSQPQIKDFGISGQARPAATGNPCTECMECVKICKEQGAIKIMEAKPVFDYTLCVLCGDCAKVCPTEAIIIEKRGLKVMADGKLGRHPRLADTLAILADEAKGIMLLNDLVKKRMKG